MADRITPPPSGDSGERRPTTSRPTGGYGERPQTSRPSSGYSDRPQQPRSSSGYGDRTQAPRTSSSGSYGSQYTRSSGSYTERPRSSSSGYGERRPAASRSSGSSSGRQSSPRRVDVIRCENCGEDYNVSYKRCPFCDERPGRGGVSGKRVSNTRGGGYGRPVNPIQIAGLVISLALIASALFIVFRFVGAPIFGKNNKPSASSSGANVSTSQSNTPNASGSGSPVTPPMVQSISLNNTDFTLDSGGVYQMSANLIPAGSSGEVTWTTSDPAVATIDANGQLTNVNAGSTDVKVTVTATCGDVSAQTSVTCKGKTVGGSSNGPVTSGTRGRIVNAEKGLNIRSGPGKEHPVVASAQNGASITILGEENGFYKINYSGNNIGYVSKDYVSVG